MKSLVVENKIIKDVTNLFSLKKEIDDTAFKHIRDIFRLKKVNESIKDRIVIDIMNLFEYEEEDHFKLVRVGISFKNCSNNYIECQSKVEIKHYHLKNILIKLNHT